MNNYQKALIDEHAQLVVRTQNLHDYIYNEESNNDHRIEFANKCIQLASMKKYEEALRARMENAGITFENGNYFERVASIGHTIIPAIPNAGKDYDADETVQQNTNSENNE